MASKRVGGICVNSCWIRCWMYGHSLCLFFFFFTILYVWLFFTIMLNKNMLCAANLSLQLHSEMPEAQIPPSLPGLCPYPSGWRSWVAGTTLSPQSQPCSLHRWIHKSWVRCGCGSYGGRRCGEVFGRSGFGTSQEEKVASYAHGHSGHQTVCQGWPPGAELKKPVPLGLPRQPLREAQQPLPALRTAKLQLPSRSGSRAGTSSPLAGGNNLLDASPLSFHLSKPKTNQKSKQKQCLFAHSFSLLVPFIFVQFLSVNQMLERRSFH